ncbi:PTS system maltose-specific EIICB component [Oceanobacillus oncorhynchi subsp. incaldanensis]|uniref:PTS system maltose-specific EIICB component n=1 Tax=Oceanobacillus oncorhynchi TaxID=545501 RepID=A0A0A1MSF9_9BACI|nr:alpha-glucoside-specific PTS transporter subunit IIBC [Oceanobacillus oncorhynchi]UUI40489.1 alpha-glucoside-specific PTS transporter subunit IIBC [Oceanobacillus oncorhynchi]GIO18577.1 PTS system maltose-specific EIICB component [Oceanobacillus oncorhynchi subsp. incaldanensis]CEI81911.1 PTS system maltose-specific EIICB component [Oceanobacillus oncorhynchi]
MMQKFQRFGSAMFVPVLFFAFSGIVIGFSTLFNDPLIMGSLAEEGTAWSKIWFIIEEGAWTVFNQMPLIFAMGIPVALAAKANGRALMETIIIFLTFNYFINAMLTSFPGFFNVDFSQEAGGVSGLAEIAGIKTLDTSILGAIIISAIAVYLHNKYYDTKLPDYLGIFQGSAFVVIIGFFAMLPVAFLTAWLWPYIQMGIASLQGFLANAGNFGVWLYIFLEKILLPTGLHHFIYGPFQFGPAIIDGGTYANWAANMGDFAQSTASLKELFPEGGFAMQGNSNIFGLPAAALAIYVTAQKGKRKVVAGLLIPATITAVLAGITEPLEFTYIFVAPLLFAVKAVLDAFLATTMYIFGVTGNFGGGLLEFMSMNWIPLFSNHWMTYLIQIAIGIVFFFIYFFVFRFMILKLNIKTPGRTDEEVKLYGKEDYKEKKSAESTEKNLAGEYVDLLGGPENIEHVTNCATRLRVLVTDPEKIASDEHFRSLGASGVVKNGNAIQVIIGLSVQNLKEDVDNYLGKETE